MEKLYDIFIKVDETDYFHYVSPTSYQKIAEAANYHNVKRMGLEMHRMMAELNATWMTASMHLEICEDIYEAGPAEVYVEPMMVNRVLLTQCLEIRRDGRPIARCEINTLCVDVRTRKVIRPETVLEHFGIPVIQGAGSMERLTMPEDMERIEAICVRYSDCDLNQHLRAYRYTDYVCDAAEYWSGAERKKGRHLYIEYMGECQAKQILELYKKDEGTGGTYVKGVRDDGRESFKAYFVVE